MLGGYQILDLRGIDLTISESASDITNANVLNQLLKLRDYIDKAYNFSKPLENQLKPVLIRFRDKKANEKIEGATFGELSLVDNYYSFKITARLSGVLVLTINVTFEEVENGYGNYEWVIDDATIQLADETQTISGDLAITGDLSVGDDVEIVGDASVGGALSVTGSVSGNQISGNLLLEIMSGYSVSGFGNWTPVYIGVSKTGNKLTVVLFGNVIFEESVPTTVTLGDFVFPSGVNAKLYPYTVSGSDVLSQKNTELFDNSSTNNAGLDVAVVTTKIPNGIRCYLMCNTQASLTTGKTYNFRHEITFLLSDNLIPNE